MQGRVGAELAIAQGSVVLWVSAVSQLMPVREEKILDGAWWVNYTTARRGIRGCTSAEPKKRLRKGKELWALVLSQPWPVREGGVRVSGEFTIPVRGEGMMGLWGASYSCERLGIGGVSQPEYVSAFIKWSGGLRWAD